MARSYSMEPQAAKEANQGGKRITEGGVPVPRCGNGPHF